MEYISLEQLDKLKDREFSILLFFANGCNACSVAKPIFESASSQHSKIGFYAMEIMSGKEYYDKFAEQEQEVVYETSGPTDGSDMATSPVPQYDENGLPKMRVKYVIPSFYVHHTKAISEGNPTGFVGGWEGASQAELEQVIEMIYGAMGE